MLTFFKPNDEIPLEEETWFHGTIDRKDVPTLLKKEGDYLVRESSTKPGQFVLSTRSENQVRHFIIQADDVSGAFLIKHASILPSIGLFKCSCSS